MATSRKKAGRRPARRGKSKRRPGWFRFAAVAVACATFALGWVSAGWVVGLDRVVRARFEGQRFRVPSRVYSAPSILYPGLDWKLVDLEGSLRRLGYRRVTDTRGLEPGQYVWGNNRVRLFVQAFDHPSRPEPARDVVLRLRGSRIDEIRELPAGREIWALLLAPEQIGAYYGPDHEQRDLVTREEVPPGLQDRLRAPMRLTTQDSGFLAFNRCFSAVCVAARPADFRQHR